MPGTGGASHRPRPGRRRLRRTAAAAARPPPGPDGGSLARRPRRGPTRARTHWAGPDIVVSVLEDAFTPVERTLADLREHERLRDTRTYLQYAGVRDVCEPVERLGGRRVRSFHSSVDTLVDGMAIATFVLHPEGAPALSRADLAV